MTRGQIPLVPTESPRRRQGPARSAIERTLRAWSAVGHLTGDAAAAARRVVRDSADAVDAAHAAMAGEVRCGECGARVRDAYTGSPGALSYATNIHAALLAQAGPTEDSTGGPDPYALTDSEFDTAAAAWLADAPPSDSPGLPDL